MIQRNLVSFICIMTVLCCTAPAWQDKPAAPSSEPAAKDTGSDLVVARIAGEPITEKEVLSAINQLARQKPMSPDRAQDRNVLLFKDALDGLTTVAVLRSQVRQQNIVVDPAKVDQQMQQVLKQFPTREDFLKALASQGVTETELRKSLEERLSRQQLLDQATKDLPGATDEEIRAYYDLNSAKFATPEQVHAAHILLRVGQSGTPEQKAEIKKKLEGIRAEIESNAITFADAAAKYSQDSSNAAKGGELGFFPRGSMVKPFEDAAFTTKPGTLSPVVETQFGYHIIQVSALKPAGKLSLEQAKPPIKQILEQSAKQRAARKYLSELKAKATVETFMTPEEFGKRHPAK